MDKHFDQVTEEAAEAVAKTLPEATEESSETQSEEDPMASVRREIASLRALLEQKMRENAKPVVTDTFRTLYPDVTESDIPDAVWEQARAGLPIEAAYALYERQEALRKAAAEQVNRKNAGNSWGKTEEATNGFLSPDEVRGMSREEVRRNYDRILTSMKHWN